MAGIWGDVLSAKHRDVCVSGPLGTSKTTNIWAMIHIICMESPGTRVAIVRNEKSTLSSTVQATIKKTLAKGYSGPQLSAYGGEHRTQELHYDNGSIVLFGGMDDASKILGAEYSIIWYNQSERAKAKDYRALTARLRDGGFTSPITGEEDCYIAISDANPSIPNHFLKIREKEGLTHFYDTKLQDNVGYFHNGDWTSDGLKYKERLDLSFPDEGWERDRYINGIWCAAEGLVYSMFNEKKHVRRLTQNDVEKGWKWISCVDYGFSCCAYTLVSCSPRKERVKAFGAVYHSGLTTDDLWEKIVELHNHWGAPLNIRCYADHDVAQSEALKRKGLRIRNAIKTEHLASIDAVKRLLIEERIIFNADMMLHPPDKELIAEGACSHPLQEFREYVYPEEKTGDPEKDDRPIKANDHFLDTVKYLARSHMQKKGGRIPSIIAGAIETPSQQGIFH